MNEETQTVPEDRGKKRERRETEIRLYQQSQWDAETAKIARLKSLRLARDAEDRSATLPARPKHPRMKKSAINPPADPRSA
jgi:hypothetical protein